MAAFGAGLALRFVAAPFGWRAAFVLAGAAGFLWIGLWLPIYSSPEDSRFVSDDELAYIRDGRAPASALPPAIPWRRLFTYRQTWAYILVKFLTDPISWFWLIWLPDFFNKTRGFDITGSWMQLVAIYTISLLLSIAGGWFSGSSGLMPVPPATGDRALTRTPEPASSSAQL